MPLRSLVAPLVPVDHPNDWLLDTHARLLAEDADHVVVALTIPKSALAENAALLAAAASIGVTDLAAATTRPPRRPPAQGA